MEEEIDELRRRSVSLSLSVLSARVTLLMLLCLTWCCLCCCLATESSTEQGLRQLGRRGTRTVSRERRAETGHGRRDYRAAAA